MKKLPPLDLSVTPVTDDDLEQLAACEGLTALYLDEPRTS